MKALIHNIFCLALPLFAALALASACEGYKGDLDEGKGDIVVSIAAPVEVETRHADGEVSDASDGGLMNTLRVWLVTNDRDFKIVKIYKKTFSAAQDTAIVRFTDVARGSYWLIALANAEGTGFSFDSYKVGDTTNDGQFTAAKVGQITAGNSPSFNDNGMPSSYSENISVGAGENVIDASLRRCVGRLTFNVRNNLDNYELFIHSIGLSDYNRVNGYIFDDEDASAVAAIDMVAFPDLPTMDQDGDDSPDGLVQVGPRAYRNVYDIYLYETNPALEFKFDMIAALYPKDTQKSAVTVTEKTEAAYKLTENAYEFGTSGQYLIRSASSSTYYLGDDGSGNLVATSFTDDTEIINSLVINNYLWTFSKEATSVAQSIAIKNVGTGKYLSVGSSASLSSSSTTVSSRWRQSVKQLYFSNRINKNTYYLSLSSANSPGVQNDYYYWYVREVTPVSGGGETTYEFNSPSASIPRNNRIIKYIDSYGASQPLKKIDRNEHVTVNINVFYNTELGQFDFEVLDWESDGKNHETTFD